MESVLLFKKKCSPHTPLGSVTPAHTFYVCPHVHVYLHKHRELHARSDSNIRGCGYMQGVYVLSAYPSALGLSASLNLAPAL